MRKLDLTPDEYKIRQREKHRLASQRYRDKHPERNKTQGLEYRRRHPLRRLVISAKSRAKKEGIPFSITEDDLVKVSHCPVLGLEIVYNEPGDSNGRPRPEAASLDRFIPELGYVPGNVYIISWRANELKKNGNLEEFKAIVRYLESGGK